MLLNTINVGDLMKYNNRPVNKQDFYTISRFPQDEQELFFIYPRWVYPVTPEAMEELAAQRLKATVITYNKEVVGYCNLYDLSEGNHCWLGNVIISPAFRGKGAGKYLIETMMDKARREIGVRQLKLMCHNINTKALVFYNRTGFKPFDFNEMNDKQGNRIVLIKMEINL
jgi:RimJ/RimL family protein N-acetyltransferase